jgi:hypothetical protein
MGSRAKKSQKSETTIMRYRAMPLFERIALKAYAYWEGRNRYSLLDLSKMNISQNELNNLAHAGHHLTKPY